MWGRSYFPIVVCSHHDAVGSCAKDGTIAILVGILLNDSIEYNLCSNFWLHAALKAGLYPVGFEGEADPAMISRLNLRIYSETRRGMFSMKKTWLTIVIGSLCLLFISMSGCSSNPATQKYADNPVAQRETLAQISTIDAILSGVYDGVVDFGTLKKYGDFGIGTFEGLDGEMLGFDGNFYQVKADGMA